MFALVILYVGDDVVDDAQRVEVFFGVESREIVGIRCSVEADDFPAHVMEYRFDARHGFDDVVGGFAFGVPLVGAVFGHLPETVVRLQGVVSARPFAQEGGA